MIYKVTVSLGYGITSSIEVEGITEGDALLTAIEQFKKANLSLPKYPENWCKIQEIKNGD